MLKITAAAATIALVSLAGTAHAGPAYQSLKECLANCIATTDPWTWARAACGLDCVADYADSKTSFSVAFDAGSTGWATDGTHTVLTWGEAPAAQVMFRVQQTPQHLPISRIEFRLMNQQHPPSSGGVLLGVCQGNNRIQGMFGATLQNNPAMVGAGGYLVAEIHYAGNNIGVDDVGVINVQAGPRPCPGDFNHDGVVDFFDYDDFVMAFEAGQPSADFNGDGAVDFFDYDDFVHAFENGC